MRAAAPLTALFLLSFAVPAGCVGDDPDTPAPSSSSGSSGASSGGAASIQCGDTKCGSGQVCCITKNDSVVTSTTCAAESACATGFFACDDAADCPSGQVCCAETNGRSVAWGPSSCKASCEDPEEQLCTKADECASNVCETTEPSVTPPNLRRCKL